MWTRQGEGVCQMSMLLHKPYLVKKGPQRGRGSKIVHITIYKPYLLNKGPQRGRGSKNSKTVLMVYELPLTLLCKMLHMYINGKLVIHFFNCSLFGAIHKLRRQARGRGIAKCL